MIERDDPQDKDLAALYREASVEQPSTGLDARILAAARATAVPPSVAKPSWVNRWRVPVVLATLAVMTTTLTLLVQDEEAGRLDMPDTTLRKQRAAPAPAAKPAGPSAPAAAPEPKPLEARRKETAQPKARDNAAPPASPPASRQEPAGAKAESAAPELSRSIGSISEEKKAAPSTPAADELRSGNAAGGAIKDQPMLEKVQPRMQIQAAPPAPAPAPRPAPYIAPAPAPAPMAAPARRADSAERDAAARTPEQWIADIRRLRQEGRAAEAEASLAEFRKRYPYYTLPEDLKQP